MQEIFKRIEIFMATEGINNKELSNIVGKSISYFSSAKIKNSIIGVDILEKLKNKYIGLNLNWLVTGFDDMYLPINAETSDIAQKLAMERDLYKGKYYQTLERLNDCLTETNELRKIKNG